MVVCCIYVSLTTFVIVFTLFLFYCCIKTQRWQVKKKVCCGGMICFLNKHELQLTLSVLFYIVIQLNKTCAPKFIICFKVFSDMTIY